MRVLVAGHAGAGKDEFARMLSEASGGLLRRGLSTSEFYCWRNCGERWSQVLAEFKATPEGRKDLAHLIATYNMFGAEWPGAQLYGEMVGSGIDILVGIRRLAEVQMCVWRGLLDWAVWVDRDVLNDPTLDYGFEGLRQVFPAGRVIVVENNGDLKHLATGASEVFDILARSSRERAMT